MIDYADPNQPRVQAALQRRCDQCHAQPGQPCTNHVHDHGPLPGRHVHYGRLENP